jgi:hypothetical protein
MVLLAVDKSNHHLACFHGLGGLPDSDIQNQDSLSLFLEALYDVAS